ncbi:MAG: sigma-54-dependent Fis family transcriptional regulator, partial [Proteobacteria bacterium]
LIHPNTRAAIEPGQAPLDLSRGLSELVADFEAKIIRASMKNISDVEELAKFLKVSRSNLYKKIKDYNIDEDSP